LRLLHLGFASVRCATSVALARVFGFATVVAGLTTALTLTLVLAFATVLSFRIVRYSLEGDACFAYYVRSIGSDRQ